MGFVYGTLEGVRTWRQEYSCRRSVQGSPCRRRVVRRNPGVSTTFSYTHNPRRPLRAWEGTDLANPLYPLSRRLVGQG